MTEEKFETHMKTMGNYTSLADTKIVLDAVVNSLTQAMVEGEEVELEGLGTFMIVVSAVPMKGPTKVPGYDYKSEPNLSNPFDIKSVKVRFDKVLKHKINNV